MQLFRGQTAACKCCESIGLVACIQHPVPGALSAGRSCRTPCAQLVLDVRDRLDMHRYVLAAAAVLQEDFPLAYYGLRYQDRHHKYKYIETPGGW